MKNLYDILVKLDDRKEIYPELVRGEQETIFMEEAPHNEVLFNRMYHGKPLVRIFGRPAHQMCFFRGTERELTRLTGYRNPHGNTLSNALSVSTAVATCTVAGIAANLAGCSHYASLVSGLATGLPAGRLVFTSLRDSYLKKHLSRAKYLDDCINQLGFPVA